MPPSCTLDPGPECNYLSASPGERLESIEKVQKEIEAMVEETLTLRKEGRQPSLF